MAETLLKFWLGREDDPELTCFFCTLPKVELSFEVRGGGQMRIVGAHEECAARHRERMTKTTQAAENSDE